MRKTVLYIAMSLDGYIADQSGGVEWLAGENPEDNETDTYSEFIKDVDTVIMGWNTYEQIVTELSPDTWVYAGLTSYVITHREVETKKDVIFTQEDPCTLIENFRKKEGKKIWICGGANLIQQLMKEDIIDEYDISVIPTVLGKGIRLFGDHGQEIKLKLRGTQTYNGITELVYERREG